MAQSSSYEVAAYRQKPAEVLPPSQPRYSMLLHYSRGSAFTLQMILGHSTLEMTRHYAEISDSDVEIKQKTISHAEKLIVKV